MKRKTIEAVFIAAAASLLGGCGAALPNLTEEEYEMVAEFAAGELMKYNKLNEGRIVSDETIDEQLAKEAQFRKNTEEYLEKVAQEEKEKQNEQKPESGDSAASDTQADMTASADIASFVGMNPVAVTYTGMEICDSYPQSSMEEYYFAMDATKGKKLVILKFQLTNPTEADAEVDVLGSGTGFWVSLDGKEGVSILATMLPNDFASYKGTVTAGESQETVLVLELPEEETTGIVSASLIMRNDKGNAKTVLQ